MGIIINGLTDTVTAADGSLNIGGDVTIPGELSYEDVTNVDSVGIVTARSGIHVTGGSVGIGTDNANVDLHLHDSSLTRIQFTDDSTGAAAGDGVIIGLNGDDNFFINNRETSKDILLFTEDTERLRITSSGVKQVKNGNLNIYQTYIDFSGDVSTPTTAAAIFRPADNTLAFSTANAERLRITSGGNVGINTTIFAANGTNLKVSDGTISRLALDKTGANARKFEIGNFGTALNVYDVTADAERLRITSAGFVGIGENNPDVLLHLTEDNADPFNTVITHLKLDNGGGNGGSGSRIELKTGAARCWIQSFIEGGNSGSGGALVFGTPSSGTLGTERLRITGGGDVLIGGQSAYTYDDTGDSNTILDVWNSGNNKRGILSLSGQTNGGSAIGTIWFNNDNNSGASPAANMKLSAAIQAHAVTSDSNASSDAGGFLKFYTKPEAGSLVESMRITSIGDIYQRDQRVYTVLHTEYRQLSGGVNSDSVGSWVDIKNFGYTPKRAGSLIVCHFQVQTWNGSTTNMNGDIYFRARFDQGTGTYVNVTYGGNNNRVTGNFDQDNNRQHLYYTHTFGFTAQNTNQHTINLQASNGSALSTDFNWFHTTDNANGCWIFEYDN